MQRRVPQGENEFEQLVHALPADWEDMRRDLGAFTYAGKIQCPEELLRGFCRKFCVGGREEAVTPVCGEITRPGSRTVRPQCGPRLQPPPSSVVS